MTSCDKAFHSGFKGVDLDRHKQMISAARSNFPDLMVGLIYWFANGLAVISSLESAQASFDEAAILGAGRQLLAHVAALLPVDSIQVSEV